ncbi:MAG: ABC transporter ATP-binding protein/permease, partial [Candidatus Poribacteria bacterium]|nr:ABC transporter ATP-binding protein/permease [Candidatus Poribacteria bacterium]
SYVSMVAQVGLSYDLKRYGQDRATDHVMKMSYREVTKYPSGQLGSLIDQSGTISQIVTEVGKASRAILMTLSYVGVMLLMSPLLTIAAIVIFGILWAVLSRIVKVLKQLSARAIESAIDTWRWSIEYLNAPRLLRLFGTTGRAKDVIQHFRHKTIAAEKRSSVINAAILPVFEIITVFGAGVFLICGYLFSGESAIKVVPGLFVFVLVFFRLKPQVKMLSDLRIQMAKLLPLLDKVGSFLRIDDKEFEKIGGVQFKRLTSSIQFNDVGFCYDGSDSNAVSALRFEIPRGQTIALVGESGSGKSTIVNLLLDLHQPTLGEILVDGSNLGEIDSITWRERIGIVDQEVYLLNTSIKENISFGRQNISDLDIQTAASTALAHEFIEGLENGYQTVVGDRGYKLSGGQQQRIA